ASISNSCSSRSPVRELKRQTFRPTCIVTDNPSLGPLHSWNGHGNLLAVAGELVGQRPDDHPLDEAVLDRRRKAPAKELGRRVGAARDAGTPALDRAHVGAMADDDLVQRRPAGVSGQRAAVAAEVTAPGDALPPHRAVELDVLAPLR